ncbi:uncharacterized protein EAE97_003144 [Botrytis byssoidea]|uniref:Uncharacterized protein n=1 Tax=Botrytis byssoidea TaxID=139641 RepID=A0A9P5ITE0_9HELO|nr:uncharacterized protein EAE97_003144 [Botrytis byssoidea]KAF7949635.1 hypothetical protein EAE97_003144 [Botrytis byssoidea]
MAPDLNSVPISPRPQEVIASPRLTSRTSSRRTSQVMASPNNLSTSSLNILPSNQSAVTAASPPLTSPSNNILTSATGTIPSGDNTGVGMGPGPLRHPRPLTAADLHLQLEKEQEAVVNRLTRELSMLRAAHNASVVSNASSTSAGHPDGLDNSNHLLSGPNHPIPSHRRHHRTSSSTSTRSITATAGSISTASGIAAPAARRVDSLPQAISLSRQNSATGVHRSGASSPAPLSGSYGHADQFSHFYHQQRPSMLPHRDYSSGNVPTMGSTAGEVGSATSVPTTARYEEAALQRQELENVKRENEALKKRIRELERTIRDRRQSDASLNRPRSESVSTSASVSIGRGRDSLRNKDVEEDESVRVGESARSGGLR